MTLRNISCGPLGFRHKPSHNIIISEYQPATSTGCYKTSPLGESLYSLLVSRTEVNNTHHSAAQFSNFFFSWRGQGITCGDWGCILSISGFQLYFLVLQVNHIWTMDVRLDSLRNRHLAFIQRTYSIQAVAELAPPQCHSCIPPS